MSKKHSEALRGRWADPEFRERMAAAARRQFADPAARERVSRRMKGRKFTPEQRARMSEGQLRRQAARRAAGAPVDAAASHDQSVFYGGDKMDKRAKDLTDLATLVRGRNEALADLPVAEMRVLTLKERIAACDAKIAELSPAVVAALGMGPPEGVAVMDEPQETDAAPEATNGTPGPSPTILGAQRVLEALRDAGGKPLFTAELPFEDAAPGPVLSFLSRTGKARRVSPQMWQAIL